MSNGEIRIIWSCDNSRAIIIESNQYDASNANIDRKPKTSYSLLILWDNDVNLKSLLQRVFSRASHFFSKRESEPPYPVSSVCGHMSDKCKLKRENLLDHLQTMEPISRSWYAPNNDHSLIARKKVDWSIFSYGTHIPLLLHPRFEDANGGVHIDRGQKETVTLILDGNCYAVNIVNVDRRTVASDSLQIRWDNNLKLKSVLQSVFSHSYRLLNKQKSESPKSVVDIPISDAEYIDFYSTDSPFVYQLVLHQVEDIGESTSLDTTPTGYATDYTQILIDEPEVFSNEPAYPATTHSSMTADESSTPISSDLDNLHCVSAVSNKNTLAPNRERGKAVYDAVMDCLSIRSRNVLKNNKVSDIKSFLELSEETLMRFPNAGRKTIREILGYQDRVRRILSECDDNDFNALSHTLKNMHSLVPVDLHHISPQIPIQKAKRPDEPIAWSVLKKTIPQLLTLDEYSFNELLSSAQCSTIGGSVNLSRHEWEKLVSAALYEDDQLDLLLSVTLGYLVELKLSSQSLESIISAIANKAEYGLDDALVGLSRATSSASIITEEEIAPIRNFRIDSFSVPNNLLNELADYKLVKWTDLVGISEKTLIDAYDGFSALPAIRSLWRLKYYAEQAASRVSVPYSSTMTSFNAMMNDYINLGVHVRYPESGR